MRFCRITAGCASVVLVSLLSVVAQDKPATPVPDLPGITTADRTPQACVNCHANHPDKQKDHRLITLIKSWKNGSDTAIVRMAQASMTKKKLKGMHPDVAGDIKVIPTDCLKCHDEKAKEAPQFRKLLHAIHIAGGAENHFLTRANGNCTSCHKLDQTTGTWSLGTGSY